ncbi:hypothetical protein SGI36_08580 [Providencia rettgeri]|uniref:hypothetical protein n=1 Tax=Providencia TaxID=586 RepID=UPI001B35E5AD|nr:MULTISPECIES: hypothetical protein [Providencia]MBQ0530468.1 hypothetical protein [Providencia rettgeri]WOB85029.1 hypothetical protein P3L40_15380 [Providencia sp. PROV040]
MDKSRQQFEEWFNDEYKTTMKVYDEPLAEFVRKQLFIVWQASRESLEVELPYKHQPKFYSYEDGINTGLNMCRDILISNGVKIKNE